MSYEDVECPVCHKVGSNMIEEGCPVRGHPNIESKWLVCECGHDLKEIEGNEFLDDGRMEDER